MDTKEIRRSATNTEPLARENVDLAGDESLSASANATFVQGNLSILIHLSIIVRLTDAFANAMHDSASDAF